MFYNCTRGTTALDWLKAPAAPVWRMARVYATATSSLRIFYNDVYTMPLPAKHRFPMEKYRACRKLLQETLSGQSDVEFCVSPVSTQTEISSTHCPQVIAKACT